MTNVMQFSRISTRVAAKKIGIINFEFIFRPNVTKFGPKAIQIYTMGWLIAKVDTPQKLVNGHPNIYLLSEF